MRMKSIRLFAGMLAVLIVFLCTPRWTRADGMIVPVRSDLRVRGAWAVKYHRVEIAVRDQVARVRIDQAFVNTGGSPIEVEYLFPVPPGAAITDMTLMADGKELPGKLLKADEARKTYEAIVRAKKDPALLEYVGYGLYKTRVFPLPPGKERRVVVSYAVQCSKDRDLVTVHYPLNTEKFSAKAIDEVSVVVDIRGRRAIGPVYSPSHDLTVNRKADDHVVATYRAAAVIPNTDFQLLYQDGCGDLGATVISHRPDKSQDGYFMALVSPRFRRESDKPIPKDIIFVLDRSGSMSGKKIAQAREALTWIIRQLNDGDRFNVVSFSNGVETLFNTPLVAADAAQVSKAAEWIGRIDASGGTNIAAALPGALGLLSGDGERPAYVLFITDGLPTVGETTDVADIVRLTGKANAAKARLLCLGVGYDVNVRLLDLLSEGEGGLSEYVKPNEPLEAKISGLYAKIRNPVMTDLALEIDSAELGDTYPVRLGDLFDGRQIVVVGRYGAGGRRTMTITGRVQGERRAFEYPVELDVFSEDSAAAYLPRLWAMRRVGFLMDQIALHGENDELVDELIALSRDYGVLTPYTSFLAEEDARLNDRRALRRVGVDRGLVKRLQIQTRWSGQQNADVRGKFRRVTNISAPPAPAAGKAADGLAATIYGGRDKADFEAGRVVAVATVRQVNHTTLYRRGRRWSTADLADVKLDAAGEPVTTVMQFDEAYFRLASVNTVEQNAVLAAQRAGEELLIRLRGRLYRILPAPK